MGTEPSNSIASGEFKRRSLSVPYMRSGDQRRSDDSSRQRFVNRPRPFSAHDRRVAAAYGDGAGLRPGRSILVGDGDSPIRCAVSAEGEPRRCHLPEKLSVRRGSSRWCSGLFDYQCRWLLLGAATGPLGFITTAHYAEQWRRFGSFSCGWRVLPPFTFPTRFTMMATTKAGLSDHVP